MAKDITAFAISAIVPTENAGTVFAALYKSGAVEMKMDPIFPSHPLPRIPYMPKHPRMKKVRKHLAFKNAEMGEDGVYKTFRGKVTNAWLALEALKKSFPEPLKRALVAEAIEAAGNTGYTVNTALKLLEVKKLVKQTNTGHWVYTPSK